MTDMMRRCATRRAQRPAALFLLGAALAGCAETHGVALPREGPEAELLVAMLAAEDARPLERAALVPLRDGMRSEHAALRRFAVRALGRLERDELVPELMPALEDADPTVRAEAANALGQAVSRGEAGLVRSALLARVASEPDARTRGVIAETLGRLRHADPESAHETAQVLSAITDTGQPVELLLGAVRGLYFLARQPVSREALPDAVPARLLALTEYGRDGARAETTRSPRDSAALLATRMRTVAVGALIATGTATEQQLSAALADPDPWVRREAALGGAALVDPAAARRIAERAIGDPSGVVRYEGVRVLGRVTQDDEDGCPRLITATDDAHDHTALLALSLLAARCASRPASAALLDSVATTLPTRAGATSDWHRPAQALLSLAAVDPRLARERIAPFVASQSPFVRTYAARAAAMLREDGMLRTLASDPHPNVRTAAVEGLRLFAGHDADDIFIAQLSESDSQLLQATAAALEGSSDPTLITALLAALDRVTAERRQTSREARGALLERIREQGEAAHAERVARYATDFDPMIAEQAARIVQDWTGARPTVAPTDPPPMTLPTLEELHALAGAQVLIEMQDGGRFELRLRPFDAPTNTARFARLARAGYFDGLTFHRVVPNFVVQGGSPAANEYAGDGPYTRDELGVDGNWRGTVGLSTRGRDTGDGQLYINLVDNVRLDHDYTVWAQVVTGMEVVDRMLEGATIRRIRIR